LCYIDPDAFLRVSSPDVVPRTGSEKDVFELIHPGVGKQECRIAMGDDWRAGDNAVTMPRKKVQKTLPDLVRFHHTSICVISWISSRMLLTSTHRIISPEKTMAFPAYGPPGECFAPCAPVA
jgi:hypothetical protein